MVILRGDEYQTWTHWILTSPEEGESIKGHYEPLLRGCPDVLQWWWNQVGNWSVGRPGDPWLYLAILWQSRDRFLELQRQKRERLAAEGTRTQ